MKFTILRQLTHSELGMFHAYRDGRETSKQRAINFDGDVVDRVFPSAKDSDTILINCRYLENESTVIEKQQWLKRQKKNWRFEGNCPSSPYFKFVEPGVLFAMTIDSSQTPAVGNWVVIPKGHPARERIVNHGESAELSKAGMIALYGNDGSHSQRILGEYFPEIFPQYELPMSAGSTGMEPDPAGLFDILARAGHQLPSAVADLIDNSISAGATEIDIHFPNPNDGGRWMTIRDNGKGMSKAELQAAMRIGNKRSYDHNDLGKFGYGLKGASWSQADCLTVITRSGKDVSSMCWDRDHLASTGKWNVLEAPIETKYAEQTALLSNGTVILLTKMRPPAVISAVKNVDPYSIEITSIRQHLELVFHRFLNGEAKGREKIAIRLNDVPLRGNDPTGHPLTKRYDPRTITLNEHDLDRKAILSVRAFVTPNEDEIEAFHAKEDAVAIREARDRISLHGRWNETQGFYFYRLDRLIKWGGWGGLFAMDEKTKLIRVSIDFDRSADEPLQVNISKQEIKIPVTAGEHLAKIVKEPRAFARARYQTKSPNSAQKKLTSLAQPSDQGTGGQPSSGTPSTSPNKSKTGKATKSSTNLLRVVNSGSAPWSHKVGFTGQHIEVTEQLPSLVELVRSIDGNAQAEKALFDFLLALEQVDITKKSTE